MLGALTESLEEKYSSRNKDDTLGGIELVTPSTLLEFGSTGGGEK